MKKFFIGLCIAGLFFLAMPAFRARAAADCSGTYGAFSWTLEEGVLTVSGEGILPNYYPSNNDEGWRPYQDEITELILEEGVTGTGFMAFSECTALERVSLPESLTVLGRYSFWNCTALEKIEIPEQVIMIEPDTFDGCLALQEILVDPENAVYASRDGILYNKAVTELVLFPEGKEADPYTIPATMTHIGAGMFSGCTGIKSLVIPDHVIFLGAGAFSGCTELTEVKMAENLGYYRIWDCGLFKYIWKK